MEELDGRNFIDAFGGRSLKRALKRIPPTLFTMPLDDLEQRATPTVTDQFIKERFWALSLGRPIKLRTKYRVSELHVDICTYTHFYNNIIGNPLKFAWILRQHFEKKHNFEFLVERLIRQVEDILDNPSRDKYGYITPKHSRILIRYLELLMQFTKPL